MHDTSGGIHVRTMGTADLGTSLVLAQAGQPEASSTPGGAEEAPGVPGSNSDQSITSQSSSPPPASPTSLLGSPLVLIVAMLVLITITTAFGGRKDKKKRAEMMASLKRQDRVQTLGGIIGTVVEIKDDEVVLRVDEGSNTRIRFAKSAIQQVLRESTARDGPQVENKPAEKLPV